jgi:hypothetical protein
VDLAGHALTVGDLVNAGTLSLNGGTLSVSGNFTNTGTQSLGSGTVSLTGGNQAIRGTSVFDKLSKVGGGQTLTFEAGKQQVVTGPLTLQGTGSGSLLALRSSVPGTQWHIDAQGPRNAAFLDVKDSDNANASIFNAYGSGSLDSGGNSDWNFFPPTATPTVTLTLTPTPSASPTVSPTPSATATATPSATASDSPTETPSATATPSVSPSPSMTVTVTPGCDQLSVLGTLRVYVDAVANNAHGGVPISTCPRAITASGPSPTTSIRPVTGRPTTTAAASSTPILAAA